MFGDSLPTPLSPMLAIRCLDLSPEAGMGFRRRFSTLLSTRLHSSARSVLSPSCVAKPAPTICRIFPGWVRVRRCSPVAWPSSCFPWLAYLHWQDFLESSICSAQRYTLAEIMDCLGSARLVAL